MYTIEMRTRKAAAHTHSCTSPTFTLRYVHTWLQVSAAVVTCGGLCPGLNDVVQNIVYTLTDYGVPEVGQSGHGNTNTSCFGLHVE